MYKPNNINVHTLCTHSDRKILSITNSCMFAIPKTRGNSTAREKYGKTQKFASYAFLISVARSRKSCNSRNMRKVTCAIVMVKYGKIKIFQNYVFIKCFAREADIYTIPKTWEK